MGSSPSDLRRIHRGLALREFLVEEHVSRASLAGRLGLSQMAASRIVRELIEAGLVEEAGLDTRDAGPGRHPTRLRLCDQGAFAAGVAFTAYSTEVAIVGATGRVVAHRLVETDYGDDGEAALGALADALNELIDEHAIPRSRLVSVGVVVAAILDPSRTQAVNAGYLGLKPFNVVEPVARRTGLPTIADNIVNALTMAETSIGAVKNHKSILVVRCATTIGATILQDGQIIRGHDNRAGRIGHLRYEATPLTCSCGRTDCLNCSASGWSVLARLGGAEGLAYNPKRVQCYASAIKRMASDGGQGGAADADRARELKAAGGALAEALLGVDQMLDPEAILLVGAMSRVPEYFAGVDEGFQKLGDPGRVTRAKILRGDIRAARAAAFLALLEKIYSPALDLAALQDAPAAEDNGARRTGETS